ncbi:MAG: hypothetical protein NUV51_05455 [Sulfuricaulis sp.]|nr:hypothetical protein [Sulfuricaulis sp.]
MAYAATVMSGGFSAQSAVALGGGVATALTAAGTVSTDALTLGRLDVHMIGTCASGAGVILSSGGPGDSCMVFNGGANQCLVYPPSGAKFNELSTNGAFILAVNTNALCKCVSATQWLVVLSA